MVARFLAAASALYETAVPAGPPGEAGAAAEESEEDSGASDDDDEIALQANASSD